MSYFLISCQYSGGVQYVSSWRKVTGFITPDKSGNYKDLERERVSYEAKEVYKLENCCLTFGAQ